MPRQDPHALDRSVSRWHYPPVPESLSRWGAYLTGVGSAIIAPGEAYPPKQLHPDMYYFSPAAGRTLPEFGLVLITRGRGEFESLATGRQSIDAGAAILLLPDVWHRYQPDPHTGWEERWCTLHGEQVITLMQHLPVDPARVLHRPSPARRREIAGALDRLLTELDRHGRVEPLSAALQAMRLLTLACEARSQPEQPPGGREFADRARDFIWSRSHRPLTVDAVADHLQIHRRQLERRFRAASGRSILAEIVACRVERATRLLRETRLLIKQVAQLAGFASTERLRLAFHAATGRSPEAFRQGRLSQNEG